jgi:hypothetical protein
VPSQEARIAESAEKDAARNIEALGGRQASLETTVQLATAQATLALCYRVADLTLAVREQSA